MNKSLFYPVALTTGDPDGIGFEVTAKSLAQMGPQKNTVFFLFRDHHQEKKQKRLFALIDQRFSRLSFKSVHQAIAFYIILEQTKSLNKFFIFDLALTSSAADWVFEAVRFTHQTQFFSSLVTGPLSKTLIQKSGYKQIGHTGIFRSFFPKAHLFMGFLGPQFNVVLATDHISLNKVEKNLTRKNLSAAALACRQLMTLINSKKNVALLGLNPHAGESGLLGSFEKKNLFPLIKKFQFLSQPLPPDAAFFKQNHKKYSCFLALYHDQGLIPFKMIHGQKAGVHITLGLPFVRTSVDHGTAKDLYNKNKAEYQSMLQAIKLNLKLSQK